LRRPVWRTSSDARDEVPALRHARGGRWDVVAMIRDLTATATLSLPMTATVQPVLARVLAAELRLLLLSGSQPPRGYGGENRESAVGRVTGSDVDARE
jgi:hypothetical protein